MSGGATAALKRGRPCPIRMFVTPSKATPRASSAILFHPIVLLPATRLNMPRKGGKKLWSLHPKLHDDIARLLEEEGLQMDFFDVDDEETNIKEWDTNVMGRFICQNKGCNTSGWSSKKIATTIRMYSQQRYNARVYHQRCRNCRTVGRLVLDSGCYAERVTYWLKKWNGFEVSK